MMTEKTAHLKVVKGGVTAASCPICDKPSVMPHSPFCSRRCAQLDLGKWLTGDYAIPAHEAMDDSDVERLLAAHEAEENDRPDEDR